MALTLTGIASWDCAYFKGADISFTGGHYGLWTLEDSLGKCQLWDVLFFSYDLGGHLKAARAFSMAAMLLGLGLLTAAAQASQYHIFSWLIGLEFLVLFLLSVATTSIFNVWIVFFSMTYVIFILIVRYFIVHPVPRRITARGSRIIGILYFVCGLFCLLTLIVMRSDYCTCDDLTNKDLEDRDIGEPCNGVCQIAYGGIMMIVASLLWFGAGWACFHFRVQPKVLKSNPRRPPSLYAHYPQKSIYSRAAGALSHLPGSGSLGGSKHRTEKVHFKEDGSRHGTSASKQSSITDMESVASGTPSSKSQVPREEQTDLTATAGEEDVATASGSRNTTMQSIDEDRGEEPVHDVDSAENESDGYESERVLSTMNLDDDDDDDERDERGCCQKFCCDFRVQKRSRGEMIMFWFFRVLLGFMFALYIFWLFLLIGSRAENDLAAEAPSTTPYFTTNVVCAYNASDPYQSFITFKNKETAHLANYTVAHCGACGYCSNPQDIRQYVETRQVIAKDVRSCSSKVYFGGLEECLERVTGFTPECTVCWADNMRNTAEKCLSTCMRSIFSGFMTSNNIDGAGDEVVLNACIYCDEKRSGPDFVTCSGVARRRLGIVSEIERNPEEQCKNADVDWTNADWQAIGFN